MRRSALFSLYDTSCAEQFAEALIRSGWDIVASRETVVLLAQKGLSAQDIAEYTGTKEDYGFPPTLHAKVEHALCNNEQPRIDLVYVIPYPLACGNDVGGRTLLALAVKGGRVAAMCVEDMAKVVAEITETGDVSQELRLELADKACFEIAKHYASLAGNRGTYEFQWGRLSYGLLNGENPYQVPAFVFASDTETDSLSLPGFRQVSGELPCFTNMADADCILNTICLAAEAFSINAGSVPYLCVAAKHGNACGMGASKTSPEGAIEAALFGNPRSIWGGEFISNFPIDERLAQTLLRSGRREQLLGHGEWMFDLVMAPGFSSEAIRVLGQRKGRKILENGALRAPFLKRSGFVYRAVRGGFLRQPPAAYVLDLRLCELVGRDLSENELSSLIISWAVSFSSNHGGNEVALAKDGALLGTGGGPSTVEAAKVAVARAAECGHNLDETVFAADSFFPFTDAPEVLCDAGAAVGCVPCGGKNERNIRELFCARGVTVAYLPREFRGFCRH